MKRYAIRDRLTGYWLYRDGWHPEKFLLFISKESAFNSAKYLISLTNKVFSLPEHPEGVGKSSYNHYDIFDQQSESQKRRIFSDWRDHVALAPQVNTLLLSRLEIIEYEVSPTGESTYLDRNKGRVVESSTPSQTVPMRAHNHWRGPDYSVVTSIPGVGTFLLCMRDFGVAYRQNSNIQRNQPIRRITERFFSGDKTMGYFQLNLRSFAGSRVIVNRDPANWTFTSEEVRLNPKDKETLDVKDPFADA